MIKNKDVDISKFLTYFCILTNLLIYFTIQNCIIYITQKYKCNNKEVICLMKQIKICRYSTFAVAVLASVSLSVGVSVSAVEPAESSISNSVAVSQTESKQIPTVDSSSQFSKQENTSAIGETTTVYNVKGVQETVWAEDVKAPAISEFTEDTEDKGIYRTEYKENQGWYDITKDQNNGIDRLLCGPATAGNMLHWWFDQNKEEIAQFIKEKPNQTKQNWW